MFTQDKYQKAIHFAANAHGEQKYPERPYSYMVHVSMVAMEVIVAMANDLAKNSDIDWDLAVQCALLHDVIEDTDTTYEDVKANFDESIANGVLALSKDPLVESGRRMEDSIRRIKSQPEGVWVVKLADRISNLQRPLNRWSPAKKVKYRYEAEFIYNELQAANSYLANRLKSKIESYAQYL